jgi:hypothetical protein
MASDNNIVLNMPFDEPEGSAIAYDFSMNRADGTVVESKFVAGGKQGNCIEFNGRGYCQISQNVIPVTGNFTLLAWLMRGESPDSFTGKRLGFWFAWNDINGYREAWINLSPDWNYIAIVKEGLTVSIYLNTQLIETITLPVQPTGFAILQDIYFTGYGYGLIDEVRAYNVPLSQEEISGLLDSVAQLNYLIDSVNLKEFDVTVSESNGVLDLPKLKTPFSINWPDYHGQVIDLTRKRIEAREIELKCWMKATGKMNFVTKLNSFLDMFRKDGTQRLTIDIHPTKPLLYEVYCDNGISISKRWNDDLMIGTFTLKLVEPDPVKRVVRHQRISEATKTLTVTLTSDKAVTIYWGDGTKEEIYGTNITRSHQYSKDGIYYAIVAGVIEEITNFQTNGIVVWNKL